MDRPLRIGSLFAGVGGFDLGFQRAGFTTAWAVEIDQQAQAVLRLRFPEAELHDDVCMVGSKNLGPVDIVTFGSPCQDMSLAGKRAGLAGARSGLFYESTRIIRELRAAYGAPRFAVWENVPGAFSSNNGEDFACVLQEMVDVGATDVAWRVLDSRWHGVAQRRRRVFLVADFGGERAGEILSLAEGVRGHSEARSQKGKGAARGAGKGATSGSRIDCTGGGIAGSVTSKWAKGTGGPAGDEHYNMVVRPREDIDWTKVEGLQQTVGTLCSDTHPGAYSGQDAYTGRLVPHEVEEPVACYDYLGTQGGGVEIGISPTLKRKDGVAITTSVCATGSVTHTLDRAHGATEDGTGRGIPVVPAVLPFDTTQITSPSNRSHPKAGDPCHPLAAGSHPPAVAFNIYPGQPTEDGPAQLHAKETDIANAVTVTEHARTTDRGTRVVQAVAFAQNTRDEVRLIGGDGQTVGALAAQPGMKQTSYVALDGAQRTVAGTLGARASSGGGFSTDFEVAGGLQVTPTMAVRRLVPVETEKLQGFPRGWTSEGIDKNGKRIVMADGPRYKQMGNAVTVNVAHAIAERLASVLKETE